MWHTTARKQTVGSAESVQVSVLGSEKGGVRQRGCGSMGVCRADTRHGDGGSRGYGARMRSAPPVSRIAMTQILAVNATSDRVAGGSEQCVHT